jgi:hypothetical protein
VISNSSRLLSRALPSDSGEAQGRAFPCRIRLPATISGREHETGLPPINASGASLTSAELNPARYQDRSCVIASRASRGESPRECCLASHSADSLLHRVRSHTARVVRDNASCPVHILTR